MQRTLRAAALLAATAALSGCIHRVELPAHQAQSDQPGAPGEPPPGMAQVDVVSSDVGQLWDVYAGPSYVCTTPCRQVLDPMQPISLKARGTPRDRILVPGLGSEALEARGALLMATGSHRGKHVNGLVFTSLGGMGMVVGITLTAVGCSDLEDRGGMCTAGLITGGVTLPLTAFAIWLLIDAQPHADVLPVYRSQPAPGQTPVTVGVGPAGISGTF